jgi:HK97 family phage portal protein
MWQGQGFRVILSDLVQNLKQASVTEKAFFSSKWKPSMIVKVDALTEEFASKEGRQKLLDSYVQSSQAGDPWLIPAEQFQVEQVRPLSLADLALNDNVKLDKQTVASILGVPAFLLGVGQYTKAEWNSFVNTQVKSIVTGIQQEMTKKLILSPKWYVRFNIMSLLDWDIQTISSVFCALSDRGFVSGNEVRDKIGMSPVEGLSDYRVLENYIPWEMSGNQKKLIQEDE